MWWRGRRRRKGRAWGMGWGKGRRCGAGAAEPGTWQMVLGLKCERRSVRWGGELDGAEGARGGWGVVGGGALVVGELDGGADAGAEEVGAGDGGWVLG